jgi:Uma2 family endonuclease
MTQSTGGPIIALADHGVEIPRGISTLQRFRDWAQSDSFPQTGRIDWVAGRLEIDMSPEDLNTHGSPKSAIAGTLVTRIQEHDKGMVFIDRARISNSAAGLSAEPDVVVVLFATSKAGDARLIPKASKEEGRFVEIEGRVDLAVECVSDSSKAKDYDLLPDAYYRAGIPEYWIADVRGKEISFRVLTRGAQGYEPAASDTSGFQRSEVLGASVRLVRRREEAGFVVFRLEVR